MQHIKVCLADKIKLQGYGIVANKKKCIFVFNQRQNLFLDAKFSSLVVIDIEQAVSKCEFSQICT